MRLFSDFCSPPARALRSAPSRAGSSRSCGRGDGEWPRSLLGIPDCGEAGAPDFGPDLFPRENRVRSLPETSRVVEGTFTLSIEHARHKKKAGMATRLGRSRYRGSITGDHTLSGRLQSARLRGNIVATIRFLQQCDRMLLRTRNTNHHKSNRPAKLRRFLQVVVSGMRRRSPACKPSALMRRRIPDTNLMTSRKWRTRL